MLFNKMLFEDVALLFDVVPQCMKFDQLNY